MGTPIDFSPLSRSHPFHGEIEGVLAQIEGIKGGVQATFNLSFEVEGKEKPSCLAEAIYRYYA